jgi:excisionase family DNA binding protein
MSATREEPHRFLSVSEAALQLQVGSATVRRWVKSGRLHAVQPAGERGLVRIPATELERLEAGDDK